MSKIEELKKLQLELERKAVNFRTDKTGRTYDAGSMCEAYSYCKYCKERKALNENRTSLTPCADAYLKMKEKRKGGNTNEIQNR